MFVQGLVMLVQNFYQANRAYARKALEKQKAIDCDTSETLVEKPTNLILLVPLLFLVYICEAAISFYCLYHYIYPSSEDIEEDHWPKLAFAILFFILCGGNCYTTISILITKQQDRWWARLRRSHQTMKRTFSAKGLASMPKNLSIKGLSLLIRSGKSVK